MRYDMSAEYDGPTDEQMDRVENLALAFFPDSRPRYWERFAVIYSRMSSGARAAIMLPVWDAIYWDLDDVIAEVVQDG